MKITMICAALIFSAVLSLGQNSESAPLLSVNVVTDLGFKKVATVGAYKLTSLTNFLGLKSLNRFSPALYAIGGLEGIGETKALPIGGFALGFSSPISREITLTFGPQFRFQSGSKPQFGLMLGFSIR